MAVYANLTIDQGSDFTSTITVEDSSGIPYDLTGHSARGKIKKTYTSSTSFPFTVNITNPADGEIDISLSSTTTSQMKAGRYVYDIEIEETVTSYVTRVVEGQVEITPGVT